jgi:two-component system, NarL family, invasion response regulator UvrY
LVPAYPTVLLADDHAVVRRGLIEILQEHFPSAAFLEASSGHEAIKLVSTHACDVAILDLFMPGGSGIDVLSEIHKLKPKLPILIMSGYPEDQYGIRVLRAGAAGFLAKESASEELVAAVRKLLHHGRYLSTSLADKLAENVQNPGNSAPHESLSTREFEILRMIALGKSLTKIGEELHISDKTVSSYRSRILQKLQLSNNAELVRYCLDHGLVQ